MPVVCLDLDGVLWRGEEAVPGASGGVAALRPPGCAVAFLSNNSSMPIGDVVAKLAGSAWTRRQEEVLTSAVAAAVLLADRLAPGRRVSRAPARGWSKRSRPRARGGARGWRRCGRRRVPPRVRLRGARPCATPCVPVRASSPPTRTRPTMPARPASPGRGRSSPPSRRRRGARPGRGQARGRRGARPPTVRCPGSRWWVTGHHRRCARGQLGWPFGLVLSGVTAVVAPTGGEPMPDPAPPFVGEDLVALVPSLVDASSSELAGAPARSGTGCRPGRRAGNRGWWRRTPREGRVRDRRRMTQRRRLDAELVRRGLVEQPPASGRGDQRGQGAGRRRPAARAARLVEAAEPILVRRDAPRFVSRGGEKLAAALDGFGVESPPGVPSTSARPPEGSPTACSRRARRRWSRWTSGGASWPGRCARTHASRCSSAQRARPRRHRRRRRRRPGRRRPLVHLAPSLSPRRWSACTHDDADLVLLVKPQFEAGRARVGKGGIVRDPAVHHAVLAEVAAGLAAEGLDVIDWSRRPCAAPTATSSSWPVPAGAVPRSTPVPSSRSWRGAPHMSAGVRKVGLVVHPDRPRADRARGRVETTLRQHGIDVRVTDADRPRAFADGMDLVISLGGDGTMLRATDLAHEPGVPVLGVNVGPARLPDRGRAVGPRHRARAR